MKLPLNLKAFVELSERALGFGDEGIDALAFLNDDDHVGRLLLQPAANLRKGKLFGQPFQYLNRCITINE